MKQLEWSQINQNQAPIIKVPLQFDFPPVQMLSKELTKLNSPHPYRICYLGPRWDNTVTFHKKYSNVDTYPFNGRKVNKNSSFLHDSMSHNQFYKNQIYYRAFQGMNPTINREEQLQFQSRFQNGNLDCVVKISQNEYDLFLRIDSNTRGNIFWYYFLMRNCKKGKKVKLNICNLTKSDTHYAKGLNPYMYSSKTQQWSQEGMISVNFQPKKLRYQFLYDRLKVRNFYQLSFEIQFTGEEEIRLAYCIPYTYSDLLKDIKSIENIAEIGILGQTLSGINIPIVMVGKNDQSNQKQVLLITGRVHPGESNSSIILGKFMKYLCHSAEAAYLREKVLTVIIPMTNPDGVILGNSRSGASGKDLNRQFKTRIKALFPEIVLLKNLVDKITQTHELDIYLDFHGHSRKKNMFIFGPSYNITQPQYYKCRVFPKILSTVTPIFRYYSCSYDIPYQKRSTARAVMLNEMQIPFVYTMESSLGFFHDYSIRKDVAFSRKKWEEIGQNVVTALKEYFQGLEQYQAFVQTKKKAKKALIQEIKNATSPALVTVNKKKQSKKQEKDIKLFKIFEEIKELEEKKGKEQKRQKDSDDQSDSHDDNEELQKQKMYEFTGMVSQFVEEESRKLKHTFERIIDKKKKDNPDQRKKNKMNLRKRRQLRFKEQEMLMNQNQESKIRSKRNEIRTESKSRNTQKRQRSMQPDRKQIISEELKKVYPIMKSQQENSRQKYRYLSSHKYFEQQVDFISVQKKANKMNVRMFNFSKMVQNPRSLRYQDSTRIKEIVPQKQPKVIDLRRSSQIKDQHINLKSQYHSHKPHYINLENIAQSDDEENNHRKQQHYSHKKHNTDQLKHIKGRIGFPPSFYRIKYHNNQRKKLQNKKQRQLHQYQEYQKITHYNGQNNLNSLSTISQKDSYFTDLSTDEYEKRDGGLFLKAKKFPVL